MTPASFVFHAGWEVWPWVPVSPVLDLSGPHLDWFSLAMHPLLMCNRCVVTVTSFLLQRAESQKG